MNRDDVVVAAFMSPVSPPTRTWRRGCPEPGNRVTTGMRGVTDG